MNWKFLVLLLVTIYGNLGAQVNSSSEEKIDADLYRNLSEQPKVDFLVVLKDQLNVDAAYQLQAKTAKGRYVFERLYQHAQKSQRQVSTYLTAAQVSFQPLFIVNAIATSGDLDLARSIAKFEEVASIIPDPWVKMDDPMQATNIALREGVEWGVQQIKADQVWQLGFTGQNVVIGGQDTGYEWEHPALINSYRGWDGQRANHDYNWFDAVSEISPLHRDSVISADNNPCGLNVEFPCDDGTHGTHTMGTITGDDGAGNQIGVAPGAKWVGCRCMERGWGKPSTYIKCFEWFLAPTDVNGNAPDPDQAPHVINNSWSCPEIEGCNESNWALMETAIDNLTAAGILVVVSAGNSGDNCHSINAAPAIFENSFVVGATMMNDTIARFSSRGKVMVDASGRTKPDIAAPGVGVRSSIVNGRYASFNGTSMAGPHVAGAVALIISANPSLAGQVNMIKRLLEQNAKPISAAEDCDPDSDRLLPNNTYGHGRIDALASVKEALELTPTSTDDAKDLFTVKAFPNPFVEDFSVLVKNWSGQINLEVFDQIGRLITTQSWELFSVDEQLLDVNLDPAMPPGMYNYRIYGNNASKSGKLIKAEN